MGNKNGNISKNIVKPQSEDLTDEQIKEIASNTILNRSQIIKLHSKFLVNDLISFII
jgi:hypothetical protein